ncbi:hypothetical protein DCS_06642 [Drechmeria coniospora]|uniref:glucan endo-1,3-beta-D-glucosidase n=1 Tax=Drechmeria coniospora TaxID=98403 RepID=A0A151GC46_DRECN|nr:hypothetical protein DCS_06642 [Drechmeria coniospora]KYK54682.1 hypothetical protein DCS_06642 [Drechmeria coniospora]
MKYSDALLLASAGSAAGLVKQCSSGKPVEENNNYFCGEVKHLRYEGIMGDGSYKSVTGMTDSGGCPTESKSFHGPLAPLDEGLSIHIRGPFHLKQAAVYNPYSPPSLNKRSPDGSHRVHRRHDHRHMHQKKELIYAIIDGKNVSWENPDTQGDAGNAPAGAAPADAAGAGAGAAPVNAAAADPANAAAAAPANAAAAAPANAAAVPGVAQPAAGSPPDVSPPQSSAIPKSNASSASSGSDWDRIAYFNAETKERDNMVFMANLGGQGSGVFDYKWGNSLAYVNSNCNAGSSTPETLQDVTIPSNKEFAIFSAEPCDETCGYSRAPDIAYKGFGGADKVFLFEFMMPMDGTKGFNADMPALWTLNSRIPRTAQYHGCSCWQSGCGEFDIYEVLATGDHKCKSTLHLTQGGGSSDWFMRPTTTFIKIAVVFDKNTAAIAIHILPDDTNFSEGLDDATVKSWLNGPASGIDSSLFQIG